MGRKVNNNNNNNHKNNNNNNHHHLNNNNNNNHNSIHNNNKNIDTTTMDALQSFPEQLGFTANNTWEEHLALEDEAAASEIAKMSRGVATFIAVLFIGYMVLGLTGNFLTILALLRCPRVRNVTAAFIISLCVADFLFCVLVLPWEVSRFLAGKWIWGEGWICTLFPLLRYWNVAVSLLSIAMITINRYIMIAHFSVYKLVYRKGWIALMIAFCWVFAFIMLLPTLLSKWGRFGFDRRLQTCSILDDNNKSPKQVLSEKRMRQHSSRSMNGSHPSGPSLQPQSRVITKVEREAKRRRNEWRITKMVLIIFIAFLITYLPITLVKNLDKKVNYPGLHVLGYVLIYISACINPVIYVIMNRQYRQAYKTVLLCRRPRLPSSPPPTQLDKAASCRRYASLRCNSCMSQPSLNNGTPTPHPHPNRPHSRPHSMHDVSYHHKKKFQTRLLWFSTFDTHSSESSVNTNNKVSDTCKDCERLKKSHRSTCVECQTLKNTKRNTVLGMTERLGDRRTYGGDSTMQGGVECSPQVFVDHLLQVETTLTTDTAYSRPVTPERPRSQLSDTTKHNFSKSSLHNVSDVNQNGEHKGFDKSSDASHTQTLDTDQHQNQVDSQKETQNNNLTHKQKQSYFNNKVQIDSNGRPQTTGLDEDQNQKSCASKSQEPSVETNPETTLTLGSSLHPHAADQISQVPTDDKTHKNVGPNPSSGHKFVLGPHRTNTNTNSTSEGEDSPSHKVRSDKRLASIPDDLPSLEDQNQTNSSRTLSDSSHAANSKTQTLPMHDESSPVHSYEAEMNSILRQTLSSSCNKLLDEVNRGIFEKHASWAPWTPPTTPTTVHDNPVFQD
ncbi:G-protein coupled receptor moody-like 3 [Homarus americanus]|uniref:G-protein coupled receptor moody-like 3 n=1 Tax=Homarus americanus TaxID=6706 RepID=A0A8J5JV25_HOMAM|nr:G-protein coupled receptor moody-like 3 [Homarus americanus]